MPASRSGPAVPEAGNAGILLRRSTGLRETERRSRVLGERTAPAAEEEEEEEEAAKARLGPGSGEGVRGGLMGEMEEYLMTDGLRKIIIRKCICK